MMTIWWEEGQYNMHGAWQGRLLAGYEWWMHALFFAAASRSVAYSYVIVYIVREASGQPELQTLQTASPVSLLSVAGVSYVVPKMLMHACGMWVRAFYYHLN